MKASIQRALSLCSALMIFLSLFVGCGTTAEKSVLDSRKEHTTQIATEGKTTVEPVTIKLLTVNNWWFKGHEEFAKLAEKKTGVRVEVENLPDEQGVSVIRTRLATSDVPDILIYYAGANLKHISPEKQFLDLSAEAWTKELVDAAKGVVSVDGKVYGSPNNSMPMGGVVYNKRIYRDLGLKIPHTWQEFIDNCEKIKAAGIVPVVYTFKDNWTAQLPSLIGWYEVQNKNPAAAHLINTNQLKMVDIPEYVDNFKKLNELKEKGYINEDYKALSYDNGQKMIANGEAAMYFMGSWLVDTLSAVYPDQIDDLGGYALPSDDGLNNGVTVFASQAFYIPIGAKHAEAAKKWLAFWATPEGQAAYYQVQKPNGAPCFKGVDVSNTYDIVKDFKKYLDEGKGVLALELQIDISLSNDLPMICVAAAMGQKTPMEAARSVDDALAKNAKDQELPGW